MEGLKETLFGTLAAGRPERLAQHLLLWALRSQPQVRQLVLGAVRWPLGPPPADIVPSVTLEAPRPSGWRADLLLEWPGSPQVAVELKLAAGFTPAQRKALQLGDVHLLVTPSRLEVQAEVGVTPVLEWKQVAGAVKDDVALQLLLSEAAAHAVVLYEELPASLLRDEFAVFRGGDAAARWHGMYGYLCAVHEHLCAQAPGDYEPKGRWTVARQGAPPYYGFRFTLGQAPGAPWWMGFWAKDGLPVFGLTHGRGGEERELLCSLDAQGATPTVLQAEGWAKAILARVGEGRDGGRSGGVGPGR